LLPGASRGIRLLKEGGGLPVVGRVAAGSPILAEEHIEAHYQLDPTLFKPRADYLLRVHGMSMRDAGILDGDLLAVHRTAEAHNNQIVVARIDDEVTVKRFRRQRHKVTLLPANPRFSPMHIDLRRHNLDLEGIGVGIIRNGKLL
jgi:repressor LexA